MNNTESIIRIAILITLGVVGFALLLGEEMDENLYDFAIHMILDKAAGFSCICIMAKLYSRWSKTDKWIARFEEWNAKGQ